MKQKSGNTIPLHNIYPKLSVNPRMMMISHPSLQALHNYLVLTLRIHCQSQPPSPLHFSMMVDFFRFQMNTRLVACEAPDLRCFEPQLRLWELYGGVGYSPRQTNSSEIFFWLHQFPGRYSQFVHWRRTPHVLMLGAERILTIPRTHSTACMSASGYCPSFRRIPHSSSEFSIQIQIFFSDSRGP